MSAQLLELLFFAGIAFVVISKLIATLGVTNDDDPTKQKSFFGERSGLKDVTGTTKDNDVRDVNFVEKKTASATSSDDYKDVIINDNISNIIKNIDDIQERSPNFNPRSFVKSAKVAFEMIIKAGNDRNDDNLSLLVDKRYLGHFKEIVASYGEVEKLTVIDAKIIDIYMFGNNAFIKILFSGSDITNKIVNLNEEWTFSKSLNQSGPDWYLTNIDRPQ
jgi:predicted lipid-binding transport protein (Tim44 family)